MDFKEEIKKNGAQGIDFMEIFSDEVIVSYTKEEVLQRRYFPKANYKFWKIENGVKVYL